jgi:nicotinamidase/pyrazinamidase
MLRGILVAGRGTLAPSMPRYDASAALIVVDVQNDFADPRGSLFVRGGEDVVPRVNEEIRGADDAGALVVYTQDWHPESTPHFQKDGGIWPVHCVHDSWGAAFHPALEVRGPVIRKGTGGEDGYSGFSVRDPETGERSATALENELRRRGVTRVAIAGLATDYCVVETVLDARRLGFEPTVLREEIRAVDLEPGDGDRALERMRGAGAALE